MSGKVTRNKPIHLGWVVGVLPLLDMEHGIGNLWDESGKPQLASETQDYRQSTHSKVSESGSCT